MNQDFMQYVYARCEKALTEDAKYMELQSKCAEESKDKNSVMYENLNSLMETKSQELCYQQGFRDAMQLLANSKGA